MPSLHRSSGSLGFSEAWPQPAHTACKDREVRREIFLHHQPPPPPITHQELFAGSHQPWVSESLEPGSPAPPECGIQLPQGSGHHPVGRRGHRPTYLHGDPLGDVHNQLHVGVVVVVGPPGDGDVLVCHLDILWRQRERKGRTVERLKSAVGRLQDTPTRGQ